MAQRYWASQLRVATTSPWSRSVANGTEDGPTAAGGDLGAYARTSQFVPSWHAHGPA
jgi:hypothetical protein